LGNMFAQEGRACPACKHGLSYSRSMQSARSLSSKSESTGLWIHNFQADLFFAVWVALNAIALAIETDFRNDTNGAHPGWLVVDSTFNLIFFVEMILRMHAERASWLKDGWNIFDFFLVSLGILDTWILPLTGTGALGVRYMTMLRLLRLTRLLRLFRVFRLCKELMLTIMGVVSAFQAVMWGLLLLGFTIFVCALLITRLVGKDCCAEDNTFKDPFYTEHFGTMGRTAFTLFQFTMEFQPDLCRRTWEDGFVLTIFFITYTCFTNLTLLNIVTGIITDNIVKLSSDMNRRDVAKANAAKQAAQQAELKAIFNDADSNGDGVLELEELKSGTPAFSDALEIAGIHSSDATELFVILDTDASGQVSLEEFTDGILRIRQPPQSKHLLQLERRLVAMDFKVKSSISELRLMIERVVDPISQHDAAKKNEEPKAQIGMRAMTSELQGMLQSEMHDWRSDLTHHMRTYLSKLQELQMKLLTCHDDLNATDVQKRSLLKHGNEASRHNDGTAAGTVDSFEYNAAQKVRSKRKSDAIVPKNPDNSKTQGNLERYFGVVCCTPAKE